MSKASIPASDEAWDERILGADPDFVEVVDDETAAKIDDAAGTQLISIRMPKSLIDAFKSIATVNNGIGYQTLMKQVLQRFVESEMKRVWNEHIAEQISEQKKQEKEAAREEKTHRKPQRKMKKAA